jgi:hypothetical protein
MILIADALKVNTVEALQKTSLHNFGITGTNNALIRLLWKETDLSMAAVFSMLTSDEPEEKMTPASTSVDVGKQGDMSTAANEPPKSKDTASEAEKFTSQDAEASRQDVTPAAEEPERLPIPADRGAVLYLPASNANAANQFDLPESFFSLSANELNQLMSDASSRRKAEDDKPLMTKAMRDKAEAERQKKYPRTMIRIRFTDMYFLQGEFASNERGMDFGEYFLTWSVVERIYDFVRSYLKNPSIDFYLCIVLSKRRRIIDSRYVSYLTSRGEI